MKSQIKAFCLGVGLSITIAAFAQNQGLMIIKPSVPKQVIVKKYSVFSEDNIQPDAIQLTQQGFVFKSSVMGKYSMFCFWEKY